MQVVILAGGRGTRLSKYTNEIPKPLIEIEGKPILEYQIENFRKYGLNNIIISVGYLGEKIKEYFKDGKKFGVNITYIEESMPLGTGGALSLLKDYISDDFILLFGDIMLDLEWKKIIEFYKSKSPCMGVCLVHPNSHPYDSDVVLCDSDNLMQNILYKNQERGYYRNIVKSGIHIFNKEILNYVRENEKQDLEKDIIKQLLNDNQKIYCYRTTEYAKDMGTVERLKQVSLDLKNGTIKNRSLAFKQKCVFLDRDGTINVYKGLLSDIEKFELEKDVSKAIRLLNNSGYLVIVITNQPVIARNLCSMEDLDKINAKMDMLLAEDGAYLDDIYICPHHPDSGYIGENKIYKIKCNCRKPKIGMVMEAVKKYNIDIKKSYFIGDTTVDIQTGINAGCKTILLKTGMNGTDNKFSCNPDYIEDNLLEAVKKVLL